jgi:hypothetical protein
MGLMGTWPVQYGQGDGQEDFPEEGSARLVAKGLVLSAWQGPGKYVLNDQTRLRGKKTLPGSNAGRAKRVGDF